MASNSGPAATCLHGGPPPRDIMPFIMANMQSTEIILRATNAIKLRIAAGDEDSDMTDVAVAEMRVMFDFWSAPARAVLIQPDSYRMAFSCAVDAAIDGEFDIARVYMRNGAFLRQWVQSGQEQFMADWADEEALEGSHGRQAEMRKCLWKTRTDRGLVLYLAKQCPCTCLKHYGVEQKACAQVKTGKCWGCGVQKPATELKRCLQCKKAEYCSKDCQRADWKGHKKVCVPCVTAAGAAAPTAAAHHTKRVLQ